MSKFEVNRFIGGYDEIAVSKEKFSKDGRIVKLLVEITAAEKEREQE